MKIIFVEKNHNKKKIIKKSKTKIIKNLIS